MTDSAANQIEAEFRRASEAMARLYGYEAARAEKFAAKVLDCCAKAKAIAEEPGQTTERQVGEIIDLLDEMAAAARWHGEAQDDARLILKDAFREM